jgi:SOS response regulatory protein OraA/RecX
MFVTGIKPHPRAPGRLVIEVDGARFATVSAEAVQVLDLEEGKRLTNEEASRLSYEADVEAAHRVAIRMLSHRPRAVHEVLRRLRERGRLEEAGLLNDTEFAEHFVRVRGPKGYGPSRLLRDLLARGVERRVAEHAIDVSLEHEGVDRGNQVRELLERRAGQVRDLPAEKKRRRLLAYLDRRGFRGRDVSELVERFIAEACHETPGPQTGFHDSPI